MLVDLIKTFLLIFAAEMGDKTQILAMTFAIKYKTSDVILGVVLGAGLNHGLAIILGSFLTKALPMDLIQTLAGAAFIIFGIMALRDEEIDELESKGSFGPIITVALAFFIGELGDKTQLTVMTLSTESIYPLMILIGAVLGMVATSGLAIYIGSKIGDKIPEIAIKISSSLVFVLFGSFKLIKTIPQEYINIYYILAYLIIIFLIETTLINKLVYNSRYKDKSHMKEVAEKLYQQTQILKESLDSICLGEGKCGHCAGQKCLLGYIRYILKEARDKENYYLDSNIDMDLLLKKDYDKALVLEALALILIDARENGWTSDESFVINKIKHSLELILFGEVLDYKKNLMAYLAAAKVRSSFYGMSLEKKVLKEIKK